MDKNRMNGGRETEAGLLSLFSSILIHPALPLVCLLFSVFCLMTSCSSSALDIKREVTIPANVYNVKSEETVVKEPSVPDFVPDSEDVSPLKTRVVDVVARNTPLRDVLYVIAEATGLNLVIERGVEPESPVTMTLKNVTAEDALNTIFSSVDYFYTITNNMLVIKAVDTKMYEIGTPSIVQNYTIGIGGDILGSAIPSTSSGGTSSSSSSSSNSSSGASSLKGNIMQSSTADSAAFGFWAAIEKSLTSLLAIQSGLSDVKPGLTDVKQPAGGQLQQAAEQPGSFTVNRLTGTIIVTASKNQLERVDRFIKAVKSAMNRQVQIEAKIIEVQLTNGLQYGIDWSQAISKWRGVFKNASFGTQNFAASAVSSTSPLFNASIPAGNFTALLEALQQQGDVRTLSNPRVSIMNGQTALLSVGTSTTFISGASTSYVSAAGATTSAVVPITTPTTNSVLSGIMIGIVPFISENGEISLTVTPIISNLKSLQTATSGSQSAGNLIQISLPIVDLREMSTTVKVRDGQMVIIGGLISKSQNFQDNKVPGLGDVPVAGDLFTSRNNTESKSELVVVLQPVIISK